MIFRRRFFGYKIIQSFKILDFNFYIGYSKHEKKQYATFFKRDDQKDFGWIRFFSILFDAQKDIADRVYRSLDQLELRRKEVCAMPKKDNDIRFINPEYKTIFTLENGDNIMIIHQNGTSDIRECQYIDEYHTEIGDNIYHICQFAEIMERNGSTVVPYRNSLPEQAFFYNSDSDTIITVTKGKSGFQHYRLAPYDTVSENKKYASELNEQLGITPSQEEAMFSGQIFGWDNKLTDPRFYNQIHKNEINIGER